MSVYFDASLIVSLFVKDAQSDRAEAYLERWRPTAAVSDFGALEVASAVNLRVRAKRLTRVQALSVLAYFDTWRVSGADPIVSTAEDVATADTLMRRLNLSLRGPDALHIAIALRCRLPLATLDVQMAASAAALGLVVEPT